jgi:hypothetical protein
MSLVICDKIKILIVLEKVIHKENSRNLAINPGLKVVTSPIEDTIDLPTFWTFSPNLNFISARELNPVKTG